MVIGDDPLEFRRVRGTHLCTVPKTDPAKPIYRDTTLPKGVPAGMKSGMPTSCLPTNQEPNTSASIVRNLRRDLNPAFVTEPIAWTGIVTERSKCGRSTPLGQDGPGVVSASSREQRLSPASWAT